MRKVVLMVVVLVALSSVASLADRIVKKNLGDINGDGKQEIAVETIIYGVTGNAVDVKILSSGRVVLALPRFSGDTVDSYKVVGKQIVVWLGDWKTTQSKWEPHYYDFTWYGWSPKARCFIQAKEGFTKKAYPYKSAQAIISKQAVKPSERVVVSKSNSFEQDSLRLANKKYSRAFTFSSRATHPIYAWKGRCYIIVSAQWRTYVDFNRDGSINITKPVIIEPPND